MKNVGTIDRTLRFIAGIILLALPFLPATEAFFATWGTWKYLVAAVGVVMLGTAAFRFCPAYTLLGIRTCPMNTR